MGSLLKKFLVIGSCGGERMGPCLLTGEEAGTILTIPKSHLRQQQELRLSDRESLESISHSHVSLEKHFKYERPPGDTWSGTPINEGKAGTRYSGLMGQMSIQPQPTRRLFMRQGISMRAFAYSREKRRELKRGTRR